MECSLGLGFLHKPFLKTFYFSYHDSNPSKGFHLPVGGLKLVDLFTPNLPLQAVAGVPKFYPSAIYAYLLK